MVQGMLDLGRREGIGAAPEGGATLAALRQLVRNGVVGRDACGTLPGDSLMYLIQRY